MIPRYIMTIKKIGKNKNHIFFVLLIREDMILFQFSIISCITGLCNIKKIDN